MAKTYGEFILECQNFEHSKEHYELTKECYELSLMNQYIESQQFMAENMADIREEYQEFDESFFVESVSNDNLEAMMEAADKKSKNIFQKIWKGIKELFKKIRGFFVKLLNKIKGKKDNSEKLKKIKPVVLAVAIAGVAGVSAAAIKKYKIPKGEYDGIISDLIDNAEKDILKANGFALANVQPITKGDIQNTLKSLITNKTTRKVVNIISSIHESCELTVVPLSGQRVMDPNEFHMMIKDFTELATSANTNKSATEFISRMKKGLDKGNKGVTVVINDQWINDYISELDKLNDVIAEFEGKMEDGSMSVDNSLFNAYSSIVAVSGNMMKMFNSVASFVSKINSGLNNIYSKLENVTLEDNVEEAEEVAVSADKNDKNEEE